MVIVKQLFWYVLRLCIKQYNMFLFNATKATKDLKNVAQRLVFSMQLLFSFIFIDIKGNKVHSFNGHLISFKRLKEHYAIKHCIYTIYKSFFYGTIRHT